jgi:hypothetical protein
VLGINPSRLGAGLTGIPFTEPKNIKEKMGIQKRTRMESEGEKEGGRGDREGGERKSGDSNRKSTHQIPRLKQFNIEYSWSLKITNLQFT